MTPTLLCWLGLAFWVSWGSVVFACHFSPCLLDCTEIDKIHKLANTETDTMIVCICDMWSNYRSNNNNINNNKTRTAAATTIIHTITTNNNTILIYFYDLDLISCFWKLYPLLEFAEIYFECEANKSTFSRLLFLSVAWRLLGSSLLFPDNFVHDRFAI